MGARDGVRKAQAMAEDHLLTTSEYAANIRLPDGGQRHVRVLDVRYPSALDGS